MRSSQKSRQGHDGSESGSEDHEEQSSGDEAQSTGSGQGVSRKHTYFDDFTLLRGTSREIRLKLIGFIRTAQMQAPLREFAAPEPKGPYQAARSHLTRFERSYPTETSAEGHPELDATTTGPREEQKPCARPLGAAFYSRLKRAEERLVRLEENSPELLDWLHAAPDSEEQVDPVEQAESLMNEWVRETPAPEMYSQPLTLSEDSPLVSSAAVASLASPEEGVAESSRILFTSSLVSLDDGDPASKRFRTK